MKYTALLILALILIGCGEDAPTDETEDTGPGVNEQMEITEEFLELVEAGGDFCYQGDGYRSQSWQFVVNPETGEIYISVEYYPCPEADCVMVEGEYSYCESDLTADTDT